MQWHSSYIENAHRCLLETWILTMCFSPGERHTLSSLSLFLLLCQLSLPPSCLLCWQIRVNQLQGISNLSVSPPVCPSLFSTTALISRRFQSVSQPGHINPSLSCLPSPQLSLTLCPNTHSPLLLPLVFPCLLLFLTLSASLSQWIPPQCRIPHLINRYAGMIRIGQQAVFIIPESHWDYRVQLSIPYNDPFIVQYHCSYFMYPLYSSLILRGQNIVVLNFPWKCFRQALHWLFSSSQDKVSPSL